MQDVKAGKQESEGKVTLRDAGRGFIFIGAIILLLTTVFFLLSFTDNEYYGLFSGRTHLIFDTATGLAFLGIGAVLMKRKDPVAEIAE